MLGRWSFKIWLALVGLLVITSASVSLVQGGETRTLRLASGSKGGVYYALSKGLKNAIEKGNRDLNVEIVDSKGSKDNIEKLDNGEVDFALVQNDYAHEYVERLEGAGYEDAKGTIFMVASLYTEAVHVVASKSLHALRLSHLRGKRVRVGALESRKPKDKAIMKLAGFEPGDIEECYMGFDETKDALLSGTIDAGVLTSGIPTVAIVEMNGTVDLIAIDEEDFITKKMSGHPYYFIHTSIPAKTYPGQEKEIKTLGLRALLVVRADDKLDLELLERVTESIFKNREELAKAHKVGSQVRIELAQYGITAPLQLHPGSRSYYRSNILTVMRQAPDYVALGTCIALAILLVVRRSILPKAARRSVYFTTAIVVLCMFFIFVIALFLAEHKSNTFFKTWSDTIWSVAVYLSSGFEGRAPVTFAGKAISMVILFIGFTAGGAIIGRFVTLFIKRGPKMPDDIQSHIIICNWNERGDKVISELHAPEADPNTELVVIADTESDRETLKKNKAYKNVYFVRGDPVLHNVLNNAKIQLAKAVIILADDKSADPDAKSGMIALAITHLCTPGTKPHIVVEAVNHRMTQHLKDAGVDEIICATDYGLGILAQCALHRKLSVVYNKLLRYSNDTNEIYMLNGNKCSTHFIGKTFEECAEHFNQNRIADDPVILLGILRDDEVILNPKEFIKVEKGDALIVMAYHSPDLSHL